MKKYTKLDQDFVVSTPDGNAIKIINSVGKFILESLDDGLTEEEISEEISEIFSLPLTKASEDIRCFLDQYNQISTLPSSPTTQILEDKKATAIVPSHFFQVAIFPNFSLKFGHESYESYELVRPLFQHLEVEFSESFIPDYQLTFQKNKAQYWEIIYDNNIIFSGKDLDNLSILAISHILELAIRKDPYLILLHASGVSYNNHSIIFPAIGGSGKSTLCAALITKGFSYINDDVIPVAYDSGKLVSLPFCLGIKQGSWSVLKDYYPEIGEKHIFGRNNLKIKYLSPPLIRYTNKHYQPRFLVIPHYEEGSPCLLKKTSSTNGLKAIIEGESLMTLPIKDNDIEYLVKWVDGLDCYKLEYSNLDEAITALTHLISD